MTAADYATRFENARCLLTVFAAAGPTNTSDETNVVCGVVNELLKKPRPDHSATTADNRTLLSTLDQVAESARQLEKLLWVVSGAASNEGAANFLAMNLNRWRSSWQKLQSTSAKHVPELLRETASSGVSRDITRCATRPLSLLHWNGTNPGCPATYARTSATDANGSVAAIRHCSSGKGPQ